MRSCLFVPVAALALGCSSSSSPAPAVGDAGAVDPGPLPDADDACAGPCPQSAVKHLVVIVQENHTFDTHFGRYCQAPAGSNPTCNDGPPCCEAIPATDAQGTAPTIITDLEMQTRDPDHSKACESAEIDDGKMDHYASGPGCASPRNVAVADPTIIQPYWDLAGKGALADRYFQPIIGQSSANDMYLARAQFVFDDNDASPQGAVGVTCGLESAQQQFTGDTIGDLLSSASVPWAWYSDGYAVMQGAQAGGGCPPAPDDCGMRLGFYPCTFDPSDIPFEYYASTRDVPAHVQDFAAFGVALDGGSLPAVSYLKAIGYKSEHPGVGDKLSDGVAWVTGVIQQIQRSRYREDTLILLTYDEGGGYYDHVTPPPASPIDHEPYGTRVPLLAVGPFVKANFVSHVPMEHSSIVKFIEWNWLVGQTGQLKGRDTTVANLGSLLDSTKTGVAVPEN
jgi:phospholipase C